jgi:hypothetical protein
MGDIGNIGVNSNSISSSTLNAVSSSTDVSGVDSTITGDGTIIANTEAATNSTMIGNTEAEINSTMIGNKVADVGLLTHSTLSNVIYSLSETVRYVITWVQKLPYCSAVGSSAAGSSATGSAAAIVGAVFVYSNTANMTQLWYRVASLVFGIGIPMFKLLQSIDDYIKTDQEAIRRRVGDGDTDYTSMLTCYEKMELLRRRSRDILSWSLMIANNACIVIAFDTVCSPFKTLSIVQFVYFTMGLVYFSPADYVYRYLYDDPMLVINHSRFRRGCDYGCRFSGMGPC